MAFNDLSSVDKYRIRSDSLTMSQVQRVTLIIVVGLIALGFGIISLIPDGGIQFEVGSVHFEIYQRRLRLPIWLSIGGTICAAVILLACWRKYRKPN